jgi:hypothetical protein
VLDGFRADQVLAERPQAGRIPQDRAGQIPLGGLEPGKKILEYFAIQAERIGPEAIHGLFFVKASLPPAQEDAYVLDIALDGRGGGSLPPAGWQRVLGQMGLKCSQQAGHHKFSIPAIRTTIAPSSNALA